MCVRKIQSAVISQSFSHLPLRNPASKWNLLASALKWKCVCTPDAGANPYQGELQIPIRGNYGYARRSAKGLFWKTCSFGTNDPSQSPETQNNQPPSTASGKKNSSRDTIKHGLFSKDLVIQPADIDLMAMEPSCLDGSRLLLARPGPYHQVTGRRQICETNPTTLFRINKRRTQRLIRVHL